MSAPPDNIQNRMLFAVDHFDECHLNTSADGTPRDDDKLTEEFWKAFAEWAPYALEGVTNIETAPNGTVRVTFELPQ